MNETVLEVKNIVTEFSTSAGTVRAVNDVSFTLEKGKILGIVGESGCGKSVTALSIMQLLDKRSGKVSSGQITYNGENMLAMDNKAIRKIRGNDISMIFQEPMTALNPVFTVGYQIAEVLEIHENMKDKEAKLKCIELLEKVGIPRPEKVIDEYPHQLSGGMRQRVMIAMALSCNPRVLIADEPTTALDVTIQAQVLDLMKLLIEEYQMAIMFITHDLGVIAEMANQVVVMYAGKIVEKASAIDIFENPCHPYTIGLMNSRPALVKKGEKLKCIDGMVPSLSEMPEGCAFAPRCKYATEACNKKMPELLNINENGHQVRCINIEKGRYKDGR